MKPSRETRKVKEEDRTAAAQSRKGVKEDATRPPRSVFGDLTNADKKKDADDKKGVGKKVRQPLQSKLNVPQAKTTVSTQASKTKKAAATTTTTASQVTAGKAKDVAGKKAVKKKGAVAVEHETSSQKHVLSSQESQVASSQEAAASSEMEISIMTDESMVERDSSRMSLDGSVLESSTANQAMKPEVPEGVDDIDGDIETELHFEPLYAYDIFEYYKEREVKFMLNPYMSNQPNVNQRMRAVLVDWMVEVQENFELNHETLYLAVKLMDTYMAAMPDLPRENVQLVGAAALYLAAKYDERVAPAIDDFTYICDHAYDRVQFEAMERELFKRVDFDLGRPISYRFLRRYARCGKSEVKTLYVARFMLELSLMEYKFVFHRESMLAAACLYIARKMCSEEGWTPTLEYYTGYTLTNLKPLILDMNNAFSSERYTNLTTTRDKYKHHMFHSVEQVPHLSNEELFSEEAEKSHSRSS